MEMNNTNSATTIMETSGNMFVDHHHHQHGNESPLPPGAMDAPTGETDSRRSSTKRRVLEYAAARLRQQFSVEATSVPLAASAISAANVPSMQQSLPFNRISRQRIKRSSRESILRNSGLADDMLMMSPPLVSQTGNQMIDNSQAPQQRLSGSSLRQSILGGMGSGVRKLSTDSGSRMQQQQTPTTIQSTSSFSHGGSVKQPKKVAFAKSELDDFDQKLFKPNEFDDVFSDLKIDT